ncbi:MAG: RnfH family protein [Proteobacteria bacterium]|nr:RnfH family protein [Pseudomonadota bacterium]
MIQIKIAYANPQRQVEIPLMVEESCTVAIAIQRSGILSLFPEIKLSENSVGIYGQKVLLDSLMKAGDRVEIYRSLLLDPNQARLNRVKGPYQAKS